MSSPSISPCRGVPMSLFTPCRARCVGGAALLLALAVAGPAVAAEAKNAREVRAALAKEIDFAAIDDPKTTLKEFLDFVAAKHGLKFKIDDKAFAAEELRDPAAVPIATPSPLAAM